MQCRADASGSDFLLCMHVWISRDALRNACSVLNLRDCIKLWSAQAVCTLHHGTGLIIGSVPQSSKANSPVEPVLMGVRAVSPNMSGELSKSPP